MTSSLPPQGGQQHGDRISAVRHGYDCVKVMHDPKRTGYLHGELDDRPYDVDGVNYCGRYHLAL